MQKRTLVKGALTVLLASIITRILGFFFRIYIADKLGAEGMGLYQLIVSLYMVIVTFATYGISFAVSRIVSENSATCRFKNEKTILKLSIFWAFSLSIILLTILMTFANQIGNQILRDSRTTLSIFCLAPGLPFMAISSCIKGYFYAKRKPIFPSSASVLEQIAKMGLIFFLLSYCFETNNKTSCAIVAIGMTAAEISSCIYMSITYFRNENKSEDFNEKNKRSILRDILKISIPIQISSTFNAALKLAEGVLVIECLKIFTKGNLAMATGTYGIVRGMVLPLIFFPTSILQSIITVLVPELSGENANGNDKTIKNACEKTLQLTFTISFLIAAIFIIFPNNISGMLYKNSNVGPFLKILAVLCPLIYSQIICMGMLNALGKQMSSMAYNIADGIVRIVLIITLIPKGGVTAYITILLMSNVLLFLLYVIKLIKSTSMTINLNKLVIKPLIAIVLPSILAATINNKIKINLNPTIYVLAASFVISLIYFLLLIKLGCFKLPNSKFLKHQIKLKTRRN